MTTTAKLRLQGEDATAAAFRSALGNAQGAANRMKGLFTAAFAGISVVGIARLGARAIELGDDLNKAAIKAGIGAHAISELAYVAKMSDVPLDALSTSLKKMQISLSEAGTGAKEPNEALTALGIAITNIKDLAADEQFELIADRISELRNPADRARAAVDLFGKAGADLLPIMEKGAAGIRAWREEAQRAGQSFGPEQLKALSDADESIKRMTASWEGLTTALTAKVAPAWTAIFEANTAALQGGATRAAYELKVAQEALVNATAAGADVETIKRIEAKIAEHRAALSAHAELSPVRVIAKRSSEYPKGFTDTAAAAAKLKAEQESLRKVADDVAAAFKRQQDAIREVREYYDDLQQLTMTSEEQRLQSFERIEAALGELLHAEKIGYEEYNARLAEAAENVNESLGDVVVTAQKVGESFRGAFDDAQFEEVQERVQAMRAGIEDSLTDLVAHGKFKVHNLVDYMIEEFARLKVVRPMLDSLFSSGLGAAFTSAFGGGSGVIGGYDDAYDQYDGGMALGKLSRAGASSSLSRGGGGAPVVNIVMHNNTDMRGATPDAMKMLPAILEAHGRRTVDAARAAVQDDISRRGRSYFR